MTHDPWKAGKLKLFASHLASEQASIGSVGSTLSLYGVSCFVAHNSIAPSEEWQNVIETALRTCDAMAVFLHKGFHESYWCDQEVGYALARRVPVLPINIDIMPYGFMGKLQAVKCQEDSALQIAWKIVQWLVRTPATHAPIAAGLVTCFEGARSYDMTRRIYGLIEQLPSYTPLQLQRLETAASENDQVRDCVLDRVPMPELIQRLIRDRGGSPARSVEAEQYYDGEPF